MRVLVTGGTGVVGKPAVDHLLKGGHQVRLLSRHAERDVRQWASGVEPYEGSVGDPASVRGAAEGCDAVLHIAGVVAEKPPEVTFQRINVDGTRNLLEEAHRAGCGRFVYLSSLGAERGESDYHRSKLAAEELVRTYPGGWLILRPGNVYGPGDEVISLLLQMVRTLPVVPVVGRGDQPFQPVWADDLGQALAGAVERDDLTGRVLELAGPEVTTMNDLLDRLGELTGKQPARLPIPGFLAQLGAQAMEQLDMDLVPINEDQLIMLEEGNVIESPRENALISLFGVEPVSLMQGLGILVDAEPERLPGEGVGELRRQRYWADVHGSSMDAAALIRLFRQEFSSLTPRMLEIGTEPGSGTRIDPGETITMDLPLRGTVQVRVEAVTDTSVTLATLAGHHLAGIIRFQAHDHEHGRVRFEIVSFTRAGNWLDQIGRELVGIPMQKLTWRQTVEAVVERSGGTAQEGVQTEDTVIDDEEGRRIEEWAEEVVMRRKREESRE